MIKSGFTLIELLITVAIVSILAAVAYPSYSDFVTKSNRTEGQGELLRYANLQEQYFNDFRTYADELKKLGASSNWLKTEYGHYKITVKKGDANEFELRANAQGAQKDNDSACKRLIIINTGDKTPKACWN